MSIKYPHIDVQLSGEDGNAYSIIGRVKKAIEREEGHEAACAFREQAMAVASYDDLLALAMHTVNVL